jgi:hypothetical protein
VLFSLIVIYAIRKDRRVSAVMSPVASALGARYANGIIRGELQGVKFQMALLRDVTLVNPLGLVTIARGGKAGDLEVTRGVSYDRFVVRAKVPGLLPLGLIAVPSPWSARRRTEPSPGLCGDPELEKTYIFQTNDPEKSRRLLEDAEVRQALKTLMQRPPGAGLVFDDCVHIAYETQAYPKALESPEEARRCVDTVVQAALALDRVFSRIQGESEAVGITSQL